MDDNIIDEELLTALGHFVERKRISEIWLLRKMGIGYSRAKILVERIEKLGYISEDEDDCYTRKLNINQEEYDEIVKNSKK